MPASFGHVADHFQDPLNRGQLADANRVGRAGATGNMGTVVVYLRVDNEIVQDARHESRGCGYTVACGSILTEWAKQKSVVACLALNANEFAEGIEGIPLYKRHCPLLVVTALHDALRSAG